MTKKTLQWTAIIIFLFVSAFFFCTPNKGYITKMPKLVKLYIWPTVTLEQLIAPYPEVRIKDKANNIVSVPFGRENEFVAMFKKTQGVSQALPVQVKPQFSLEAYMLENGKLISQYLQGDFGSVRFNNSRVEKLITEQIKLMFPHSLLYIISALGLSVVLGITLSVIAALSSPAGRVLDGLQVIFLSIPDFALITLLQVLTITASKIWSHPLLQLYQLGSEKPIIIPLLTVSLLPTTLLYGTLRMAVERELSQNYIRTASAIGLSLLQIVMKHVLRNVWEDLLAALPKATTMAVASMVIAEVICNIMGVGGYMFYPDLTVQNAMPFTIMILIIVTLLLNGIYALLRKLLIPVVKEVA
ncbi:ABC transporter permease subunit [Paenibacillus alginolyticus]|uniref:ABC transporter permease subunit n=1 Tax=Paenibacillus alginolyticus TaxID=59839 RepID=UPI00041CF791|nr:ABC transporter permease subunit [Paenibacillus alginolyticus]MCY9666486.1 ABC transporter permease subunit [Paenibacillus alginolyticus]